uniref:Zgc:195282 n=1 Tax=Nothobranchius furzeri TaxID=105023 RepID=A0A8C6L1D0_NOTFU
MWARARRACTPLCGFPPHLLKRSLGRDYHPLCLKCQRCKMHLNAGQHAEYDERPFCRNCYLKLFGPRGETQIPLTLSVSSFAL